MRPKCPKCSGMLQREPASFRAPEHIRCWNCGWTVDLPYRPVFLMPNKKTLKTPDAMRECRVPGCRAVIPVGQTHCLKHLEFRARHEAKTGHCNAEAK